MSEEQKLDRYIAVDSFPVSIIRKCTDRACDKYHEWVRLDSRAAFYDVAQIAKAMNEMESR